MKAVGEVIAIGPGLTGRKVKDLVGYAGNPMGSYAEEQILPAKKVVPLPPSIDPIVVASIILKGMAAQFLLRRCFKVEPGHTILVHAAAGGVGSLLCQWTNSLGATVIGTVSAKEKAAQAKDDGCHHVIIYKEEDFVARVNEITSGKGVDVVYDSVGKDTFQLIVQKIYYENKFYCLYLTVEEDDAQVEIDSENLMMDRIQLSRLLDHKEGWCFNCVYKKREKERGKLVLGYSSKDLEGILGSHEENETEAWPLKAHQFYKLLDSESAIQMSCLILAFGGYIT
ncbi:hypothetical protein Dsin_031271 [Dipteronia sinensis]|uniref:Enoyl reductase (ER) domain-containing protein n=1 Tax=Dipteronia sinensis TaxID=43782 RepID=A0AAD9ZL74_9ROSI|nr:hypothetical protein Dsin_031271 [Dipteronia sinensis]